MAKRITIRMPKAKLSKWLKALRSGKYRQGVGVLEQNGAFCCLGVLQHCISGETHSEEDNELPNKEWLERHRISFLGRDHSNPMLPRFRKRASTANDCGKTFDEIADAIQECAEGF